MTLKDAFTDLEEQGIDLKGHDKCYIRLKDGTIECTYDNESKSLVVDIHDKTIYISEDLIDLTEEEINHELDQWISKKESLVSDALNHMTKEKSFDLEQDKAILNFKDGILEIYKDDDERSTRSIISNERYYTSDKASELTCAEATLELFEI